MKIYKSSIVAIICILFCACQPSNNSKTFEVSGTFVNTPSKKIYLAEMPFNSDHRTIVDTTEIDAKGNFKLETPSKGEGIYQVFIENGPGLILINDVDKIELHADAKKLGDYTTPDSKANEGLKKMFHAFLDSDSMYKLKKQLLDSTQKLQIKTITKDSLLSVAELATKQGLNATKKVLEDFMAKEANGTGVYYAAVISKKYYSEGGYDSLLQTTVKRFPNHPGLQLLRVNSASKNSLETQGQQLVGKPVPDIALADTSGKMVTVSSFKGKWLLIDFWASWCAPCRAENPNVVAAFKQFQAKNFTVLGISLDEKKDAWQKAIAQDGLTWTHISDLKQWESKAVTTYNFNGIPFNILVDPKGFVVAVNLRGPALQAALAKQMP